MSRLIDLLQSLQNGNITAPESQELEALLLQEEPAAARQFLAGSFSLAQQKKALEPEKATSMLNAILSQQAGEAQQAQEAHSVQVASYRIKPQNGLMRRFRIAASVAAIMIIALSIWLYNNNKHGKSEMANLKATIVPGSSKATLTLANGDVIVLDSTSTGLLAEQNGMKVINLSNGRLAYQNLSSVTPSSVISLNTLTTPNGGQYQLILPDGTKIWLNAASSVTYPTAFAGNERKISISGEAYLEVAKDAAHPFIVTANDQKIQVLGTSFNINAYNNESATRTTLLEGSIKVSQANTQLTLAPSQQAITSVSGITIETPDTEAVMAWKNGLFHFNSAGIEEIMRQVARWYDIEVVYEGKITTDRFTGKVARTANISELLKVLEESGLHFKIQNQKIIVYS